MLSGMKKKKFQFSVHLNLQELTSVPFVTGVVYAKVRLIDGGQFTQHSPRIEVDNHRVRWNCPIDFSCKLSASGGILEPSLCRVSVRKELDGGRSCAKLGFVDINLAEFAGSGTLSRNYLLQSYNEKKRKPDNSILKVSINMKLISGDVLFKASAPFSRSAEDLSQSSSEKQSDYTIGPSLTDGQSSIVLSSQSAQLMQRGVKVRRASVDSGNLRLGTGSADFYHRSGSSNDNSRNVSPTSGDSDSTTATTTGSLLDNLIPNSFTNVASDGSSSTTSRSPPAIMTVTGNTGKQSTEDQVDLASSPVLEHQRQRSGSQSSANVTTRTGDGTPLSGLVGRGHGRACSVGASPMWAQKGHRKTYSQLSNTSEAVRPTSTHSMKSEQDDESLLSGKTRLSTITVTSTTSRVEKTRGERPEDIIANLVQSHDLSQQEGEHSENLQLYLDQKGVPILTGHDVDEKCTHLHRVEFT